MILAVIIAVLSLDRLTKFLVTNNLAQSQSITVIKGVLHITLVHNRGAAFGVLRNLIPLIVAISLVAITLIYLELKNQKSKDLIYSLSLSLLLSGAIGNIIDRLFFGYVIDFIDLRVWPVFNVADSAITVGVVLLGWSVLFQKKHLGHKVTKSQSHQ